MAGRQVTLIGRDPEVLAEINVAHTNRKHLGAQRLSPRIARRPRYSGADLVILAVPAQATRAALEALGNLGEPVVLTAKGLEHGTLKRQSEILAELAPNAVPFVLSGPSFAVDVAAGRPTAVTLAGDDDDETEAIAAALAGPSFRLYAAGDLIGVELAGALKNVYALAAGAVDGAKLGASARAGLIARAFAELSRIVVGAGRRGRDAGRPRRARRPHAELHLDAVAQLPARRRARAAATPPPADLAEGVFTAPVALQLARQAGVDAPLIEAVNLLLGGQCQDRKDRRGPDVAAAQTGELELQFALVAYDRPNAVARPHADPARASQAPRWRSATTWCSPGPFLNDEGEGDRQHRGHRGREPRRRRERCSAATRSCVRGLFDSVDDQAVEAQHQQQPSRGTRDGLLADEIGARRVQLHRPR